MHLSTACMWTMKWENLCYRLTFFGNCSDFCETILLLFGWLNKKDYIDWCLFVSVSTFVILDLKKTPENIRKDHPVCQTQIPLRKPIFLAKLFVYVCMFPKLIALAVQKRLQIATNNLVIRHTKCFNSFPIRKVHASVAIILAQ